MRKVFGEITDFILFKIGDAIHNHPDLFTALSCAVGATIGFIIGAKFVSLVLIMRP